MRARTLRGRWKPLLALAVLIALLHASVLDGVAWSWRRPAAIPNVAALQVRTVPLLPELVEVRATKPVEATRSMRARAPAPATRPERVAVAPAAPPEAVVPVAAEPASQPVSAPAPVSEAASAAPVAAPPARVPPDITITYDLQRGLLRGTAQLKWATQQPDYQLSFNAEVAGLSLLKQASTGQVDDTGLAPLRFTDQRAGREVRATNFQREAGKITFSGPSVEFPLAAGTQDRLSWMVQLAAIVSADKVRRQPGGQVALGVVGTRGDLSPWVFRYVGDETVDTGLGPVMAAKFVRERRDAYDTDVEVWLDLSRYGLPARAVLRAGPDEDALELRLRQAATVQP